MLQAAVPEWQPVLYDEPGPRVARVTLSRPEKRNAQNMQMTYDLNGVFDRALRRPHVVLIVRAAKGQPFGPGHDASGDGLAPMSCRR
jgi:enoyl-CoA hydratase